MTIAEAIKVLRKERRNLLGVVREGRDIPPKLYIECRTLAEALRLACAALRGIAGNERSREP